MSDEVPFGIRQIAEGGYLPGKLLDAVLAKNAQSGSVRLDDAFDRKSLTHAHQYDFVGIAARPVRCFCDSLAHLGNIFGNGHNEGYPAASGIVMAFAVKPTALSLDGPDARPHTSINTSKLHNRGWRGWIFGPSGIRQRNSNHDDRQHRQCAQRQKKWRGPF